MMNRGSNDRQGMSTGAWHWSLWIVEALQDIIKGGTIVLGVLAASIADAVMGAVSITILFGSVANYTSTPAWLISTVLSLGNSAFQIYLFALLQKRNIGFKQLFNWKKLDSEVKTILIVAGALWLIDTFMDVSPVFLLVQESQYKLIPTLWKTMIVAAALTVFILCGFSELLTSNMSNILQVNRTSSPRPSSSGREEPKTKNNNTSNNNGNNNQKKQGQEHRHQQPEMYKPKPVEMKPVEAKGKNADEDEITTYLRAHHK